MRVHGIGSLHLTVLVVWKEVLVMLITSLTNVATAGNTTLRPLSTMNLQNSCVI